MKQIAAPHGQRQKSSIDGDLAGGRVVVVTDVLTKCTDDFFEPFAKTVTSHFTSVPLGARLYI